APKGGSVGKHFDFYDVFLVQGYGHRRWQLGQMCDASTEFVPNQPLKLLPEIDVHFDEVLAPGDLLYVPPGLSHYGVAEDDCLTFSFGFRMPNFSGKI
ncbi:cupin domain-containing protein, partial [Klebsiella pneumoniae]|uniref:cupin domain-containing protein n=1 Tax=Klebsiella pneumoniae TaxID=573 RepID=UPI001D0D7DBD